MDHAVVLGNAFMYMYANCGAKYMVIGAINKGKEGLLEHVVVLVILFFTVCQAQSVIENLLSGNVVSWNAMIARYARNGQGKHAH